MKILNYDIKIEKRWIILIVVLAVIFGGTFVYDILRNIFIKEFFAEYLSKPIAVGTVKAVKKTWHPSLFAVGTLQAVNGVEINSQVNGQVTAIYFKSGDKVVKGQPLIQLDDRVDQQTLANNLAQLQVDKMDYDRKLQVYHGNGVSKSDVDAARAKWLQSQAAVETTRLNIAYKKIVAPFSGRIGIRKVDLGQYVTAGQSLVSLQMLDSLFVDFSLPEQYLSHIKPGLAVRITVDAYPNETFLGTIAALNSRVDENTRTLLIRSVIANNNEKLYPGQYAQVKVELPEKKDVVTVPQTAITYSLSGNTIYVVESKGKDKKGNPIYVATQRFVMLGDREKDDIAVTEGVQEGEEVVVSGQIKLTPGARIISNNEMKLTAPK